MHIHFQHLRAFAAVAETGSFTQAAERLHLTQPAISKSVRELESDLEITLLERSARLARLTEAGQALYEHARAIFALEAVALEDVRARRGLQRGRLTVGASTTIAAYWLPPYLTRFMAGHPDIEVSLVSGNTETISRHVLECRVDVGLVEGPVEVPRLDCVSWRNEPLILVAPAGLAIGARMLGEQPWVVRESGSGTAEVAEQFLRETGVTPRRRVVVGSNAAVVHMVVSGAGIALVPRIMVEAHLARGTLQEIPARSTLLSRPLYWLTLQDRPTSPVRQAFEHLLNTVRLAP